jgi:hypothetical protein
VTTATVTVPTQLPVSITVRCILTADLFSRMFDVSITRSLLYRFCEYALPAWTSASGWSVGATVSALFFYLLRLVGLVVIVGLIIYIWTINPAQAVVSSGVLVVCAVRVVTGQWYAQAITFSAFFLLPPAAAPHILLPAVRKLTAKWPPQLVAGSLRLNTAQLVPVLRVAVLLLTVLVAAWECGLLIGCKKGEAWPFGICANTAWSAIMQKLDEFKDGVV